MNESQLTELLERAGERIKVRPALIDAMRAGATRRRRRRTAVISLAAVVGVLVAAGGTALLVAPGINPDRTQVPVATKGPIPVPTATNGNGNGNGVPAGMRLVGLGRVAIAVPAGWGTNQVHCGTPQSDTVLIDELFVTLCATRRPAGVDSVRVGIGVAQVQYSYNFHADETFEIDGVRAERQRTTCGPGMLGGHEICTGIVLVPSLGTWFVADSSTSAEEVDRILERIVVVPDRVGVPESGPVVSKGGGSSGRRYAELLRSLGLEVETKTLSNPDYGPGALLKVSPFPGTMLKPGSTVTITVVAKR
ncbi:PASTA domain-containing protein [Streptomyces sp. SID13031]|uniref:PASTA domain-containing protein n=1 Tax=Streptomyces sp. SID13031 TaxID=2706046 RepID=UPI0013CDA6C6|nr:PASTA domain-containing protein [Streptomyces sp. SID13031]NEA31441.1 PASTA domain-containing protein [Streptomyces sp. SID13031]